MASSRFSGTADDLAAAIQETCRQKVWLPKMVKPGKAVILKYMPILLALRKLQANWSFTAKVMKKAMRIVLSATRASWPVDIEQQHEKMWIAEHAARLRSLCLGMAKAVRRKTKWAMQALQDVAPAASHDFEENSGEEQGEEDTEEDDEPCDESREGEEDP